MARIVKIEEQGPVEVKVGEESKWVCACGLSSNKPLCDGSHRQTKDEEEGKVYSYSTEGRKEV